jgi:hypothetical protein
MKETISPTTYSSILPTIPLKNEGEQRMTRQVEMLHPIIPVCSYQNIKELIRQDIIINIKETTNKRNIRVNFNSKKIKKEIQDKIDREFSGHLYMAYGFCPYVQDGRIALFLNEIKNDFTDRLITNERGLSFIEKVCETISHETIHKWLLLEESYEAYAGYDRIKGTLRRDGFRGC